jgi:hypothetical protein
MAGLEKKIGLGIVHQGRPKAVSYTHQNGPWIRVKALNLSLDGNALTRPIQRRVPNFPVWKTGVWKIWE